MIVIAARDASPADKSGADVVCDGKTDVAILSKALSVADREVVLTGGTFDANAGFTSAGNRYLRPAEGVTVRGAGPGITRLMAGREPCDRTTRGVLPQPFRGLEDAGLMALLSLSRTIYCVLGTDRYCLFSTDTSQRRCPVRGDREGRLIQQVTVWLPAEMPGPVRDDTGVNLAFARLSGDPGPHKAGFPKTRRVQEAGLMALLSLSLSLYCTGTVYTLVWNSIVYTGVYTSGWGGDR